MKIAKLKIIIIATTLFCPVFSFSYYLALAMPMNFDGHTDIEINNLVKETNALLYGISVADRTVLEFSPQYKQGETEVDDAENGNGITKYYRYKYFLNSSLIYDLENKLEKDKYTLYVGLGYNIVSIFENTKNEKSAKPEMDTSGTMIFATTHVILGGTYEVVHNSFLELRIEIPVLKVTYTDTRADKSIDFLSEFTKNYTIPIKFIYRYVF